MMITNKLFAAVLLSLLAGCAGGTLMPTAQPTEDDESLETSDEVAATPPEDTKGGSGKVTLGFDSAKDGLSLTEEATATATATATAGEEPAPPAVIKVSDSVEVTRADFNIAKIRVKANEEKSEAEKANEAKEAKDDKDDDARFEQETGDAADSGTSLTGGKSGDATGKASDDDDNDAADDDQDKPEMAGKMDREARREKIAAHRDGHKSREHSRIEEHSKKDRSTRWTGPYIYDAVKDELKGEAPAVNLADGTYRRVMFQLKRNVDADAADALLGNVFVIQGTWKNGEQSVVFEIESHNAMNFMLRGKYVVAEGEDNEMKIVFDVAKWFEGIDFAKATVDADSGKILIDRHNNKDILRALRRNIKTATRFGKDHDKDGKVDTSETTGQGEDTPES